MRKVSWVVFFVGVALAPLAFAGPQGVEIDVSDLVLERPGAQVYPVGWRPLTSNAMEPGRLIVGEANLLCGLQDPEDRPEVANLPGEAPRSLPPLPAVVPDDELLAALAEIAGVSPRALGYADGRLRVANGDEEAVRAALDGLRAAAPPTVELALRLDVVGDAGAVDSLFSATGPVAPGLPHVFADAEMTNVLTDYEVEIAQASTIANPVVQVRRTGASVLARVHPLPSGDRAIVEAVARVAEALPGEPIDLGHPGFGRLDRCATGYDEVAVTFLAENGKPVEQRWTGRDGRQLRLLTEATWEATPEGLLWSRLLAQPIAGFRNGRGGALGYQDSESQDRATPVRRGFPGRLADGDAEANAAPSSLEVDVWLVPAGAAVPADGLPPEGADALARVRASVVAGLPACFNGTRELFYVVDWDVEVAQCARVPDPIVHDVQSGHFIEATVLGQGVTRRLRLDAELLRLEGFDRVVGPLDVAQSSIGVYGEMRSSRGPSGTGSASGEVYSAPSMPQDTVALERPRLHSLRIAAEIPLGAGGRGVVRRSARAFTGAARDVVVVVRAPAP